MSKQFLSGICVCNQHRNPWKNLGGQMKLIFAIMLLKECSACVK